MRRNSIDAECLLFYSVLLHIIISIIIVLVVGKHNRAQAREEVKLDGESFRNNGAEVENGRMLY